jgi:hypothetical protein
MLAPEKGRFYTPSMAPILRADWLDARSVLWWPEKGHNLPCGRFPQLNTTVQPTELDCLEKKSGSATQQDKRNVT